MSANPWGMPWRVVPDTERWSSLETWGVVDAEDRPVASHILSKRLADLLACTPELLVETKRALNLIEHVTPDLPTLPGLRGLVARAEGRQP